MKLLLAGVVLSLCCFWTHAEEKPIKLEQTPTAVRKTIEGQIAGGKLIEITQDDDKGEVSYATQYRTKSGQDREFTVGQDGSLLRNEVGIEELSPELQKAIKGQAGEAKIESIEKSVEDGEVSYDVSLRRKNGEGFFTVDQSGHVTCVELALAETPAAVRKTIEGHVGDGKLSAVYRLIEDGEISYDAEVEHAGKVHDVIVAPDGKLESVQVELSEVPAEVQKTIQEKIGGGRVVRIDKSYETRQAVQSYDVEARKDGKILRFSVGPKGKFLGAD
jgi:hypothetical protein